MNYYVNLHQLTPGDEIVTPKSAFDLVQHHAMYIGFDESGTHWIIHNQPVAGVSLMTVENFFAIAQKINKIIRFNGTNLERKALTATSMFTYFVKNDLASIFEEDGIENVSTRTGIDFGDDKEVLWGIFGAGNCIELTTQSLHTSLASKCQGYAPKNGIVVGQHIKDRAQIDDRFFDILRDSKGVETDRYVYIGRKKGVYYTQYNFDWFSYLKSLPYIGATTDGKLYIISAEEQEQARTDRLRSLTKIVGAGNAYTDQNGRVTSVPGPVKNQEHRFHYE